ncbi:MAG: tRNA (N6-isopentenyl adenosine(37)-C2)-methylthiotransferase MiaB [Anaerolineae bacterium]
MRYYLWTIGCQMNVADSRRLAEELMRLGGKAVSRPEEADLIVLNSCVVRRSAEERVYGRLSSLKPLKRQRPEILIALMGCAVGPDSSPLQERFPFVDFFLRPGDIEPLLEMLKPSLTIPHSPFSILHPPCAYVPVIYGCDNFCTYCIVPYRRGRERSRPVSEIVTEAQDLVRRGAREVTLLGQNVDSYGHDLPGRPDLADLLEAVHDVEGLWRIRFLTSHPKDMSDKLIETVSRLPKVCEHIELPVQSGDDEILKRMGRGYTVERYLDLVERIRRAIPGLSLVTDVIVGFPGETEKQFMNTYNLLEELCFDMVHVAAYSPRPETAAARLPDDVPPEEKERRRRAVEELQEKIAGEINRKLVGETVEILVEEKHKGKWKGRTRTNKLVFFPASGQESYQGRLVKVCITWAGPWSMQGEPTWFASKA